MESVISGAAGMLATALLLLVVPVFWFFYWDDGSRGVLKIKRDLTFLIRGARVVFPLYMRKFRGSSVPHLFKDLFKKHPDEVCFIYGDQKWTYRMMEELSNKVANHFKKEGLQHGEEVALFMESRPEYVAIWLGLSKLGVLTALINTNLKQGPLIHCITVVKCKAVIYGTELEQAMQEVIPTLVEQGITNFFRYAGADQPPLQDEDRAPAAHPVQNLNHLLEQRSTKFSRRDYKASFNDRLLYIYTSGTTGLPKACIVKHSKIIFVGFSVTAMYGLKRGHDVMYTCLPLYHSAGGILGISQALLVGIPVVIRHKFSASRFWDDITANKCTIFQYIGEICRYLLAQPMSGKEKNHQVHSCVGNGLRPQIWREFQERFNIPKIYELYGATEGNANLTNIDSTPGAVGFISPLISLFYPVSLIRVDEEGEPMRNNSGQCLRCKPGQPGEIIGKIRNTSMSAFDGYAKKDETQKKILRNVFRNGDTAFRSGDILVMDNNGYLYFKDRQGDTFRWKGENVATAEVEGFISKVAGLKDSVVYGVQIPGTEGRAGMAAIASEASAVNLDKLAEDMLKALPRYEVPLFLRFVQELDMTGTYKVRKLKLRDEGFNVQQISDPLFYFESKTLKYKPLTNDIYQQIQDGHIRY